MDYYWHDNAGRYVAATMRTNATFDADKYARALEATYAMAVNTLVSQVVVNGAADPRIATTGPLYDTAAGVAPTTLRDVVTALANGDAVTAKALLGRMG